MLCALHQNKNQVPVMWTAVAYLSEKSLGGWLADLNVRVLFFRRWSLGGSAPTAFLLPAFFFPQGLLTATLQRHARLYQLAIDTLGFEFEVERLDTAEDVKAPPQDGILVQVYLDR